MKECINQAFSELGLKKYSFMDHDVRFLFGDLNFRVDLSYEYAYELATWFEKKDVEMLKDWDQLLQILAQGEDFPYLYEDTIEFRPTYRFNIGTQQYDTSKKKRIPAWCDRILYWKNEK